MQTPVLIDRSIYLIVIWIKPIQASVLQLEDEASTIYPTSRVRTDCQEDVRVPEVSRHRLDTETFLEQRLLRVRNLRH
jgi:hypothetical protein